MNRFLMLVGVAAVAAAMYVAASPASQQSTGPTAKQFKALQKTVTAQGKTIKTLKQFAGLEVTLIEDCVQDAVPIDQFGNPAGTPAEGYKYQLPVNGVPTEVFTTGLDVTDPAQDTGALFITGGDANCGTLVNGTGLRHAAAKAGIQLPRTASHGWSFSTHQK
ncbi:MAG TPA: hypothetical protein VGI69_08910 [Gaiellaceae bacterium]|jgi:hypothetical protein